MSDLISDTTLTVDQAYRAMFHFISSYWMRGNMRSDDLAMLLHAMETDGEFTKDPAFSDDWLDAVKAVTKLKS